ncbi:MULTISPECIES: hypothetical protein [Fusobacterium]|jgi:hypothetical protein|uniref:hypothetical protein n=1 Tax=Fusobacterium TaxID=848 RepID=UPI000E833FCA|nr:MULTISPECIES: hypothetical protein [Fusobacterium]HBJ77639.1 hypothetical protein [Fusobacterium sp.]
MASEYKLNLRISKEDLELINGAGKRVVLVKENGEGSFSSGSEFIDDVAWVTFQLWELNNVTWQEEYYVYASDVEKQSGAVIEKASYEEAEPKTKLYTFDKGYFSASQFNGEAHPTAYFIKNGYDKPETFGLAQTVKVGKQVYEANPINAMTVFNNEQAYFIPIEKVKVFLAARAENGKVISIAQSQALLVDFTEKSERTITYDRSTSKFVIVD